MSFNLLQSAKELFNNDVITRLSSYLGENEASTQKALDASLPVLGMGIFDKAKSSSGADTLLNLIRENGGDFLQNLAGSFDSRNTAINSGQSILSNLFGGKLSSISDAVSRYAGISGTAAGGILSVVASTILGLLGRHVSQSNLSTGGLTDFLRDQSSSLSGFIPSGFGNVLGTLGLGSFAAGNVVKEANIPSRAATSTITTYNEREPAPANRWLWPLILVLLIAAALWYFLGSKGCNNKDTTGISDTTATTNEMAPVDTMPATTSTPKGSVDATTGDYIYDVGNMTDIKLPDGTVLHVGENSTEAKLVAFLNDASATVDTAKGNWFEFTNVRFKTASSQLSDSSMQQLKNFAAIAKAYPKAQFKIGGYTDNTGDAKANVSLSQKRADAVYAKALSMGVSKNSLTGAKGYGPDYPIGDNNTAEGRAMNRRVAVNVKAK